MAQKAAIVILFTNFVSPNRVIFGDMKRPLATYSIESNLQISFGVSSRASITPPLTYYNQFNINNLQVATKRPAGVLCNI